MIKYRTCNDKIEAQEVIRETAKMVVLAIKSVRSSGAQERMESKRSTWCNWHDTWDDAKAFLLADAQGAVDAARSSLEQSKSRLGNIKGMVQPPRTEP